MSDIPKGSTTRNTNPGRADRQPMDLRFGSRTTLVLFLVLCAIVVANFVFRTDDPYDKTRSVTPATQPVAGSTSP